MNAQLADFAGGEEISVDDLPLYIVELEEVASRVRTDLEFARSVLANHLRKQGMREMVTSTARASFKHTKRTVCVCHGVAPWHCETAQNGIAILMRQAVAIYSDLHCERT